MARSSKTADAVVCGAGIAGVAAAWSLVTQGGLRNVTLVEAGEPLSLTSDKSTECYRNWWPGPDDATTRLTNRSIDMMETLARESGNRIGLNRRGYLFATADLDRASTMIAEARTSCRLGAGSLRVHGVDGTSSPQRGAFTSSPLRGALTSSPQRDASTTTPYVANSEAEIDGNANATFAPSLDGADALLDPDLIRQHFPYLNPGTVAVLHVRRAGFLSAQQLGMLMLERSRERGVRLQRGEVEAVHTSGGRVNGVTVATPQGRVRMDTPAFINAAGPYAHPVAKLAGVDLPVFNERHCKLTFDDTHGAVARDAPLLIWCDRVTLPFNDEEREILAEDASARRLLEPFPAGVHARPLGRGRSVMLYWTYHNQPEPVEFPVKTDAWMPEILLRGMSVMIPALGRYFERLPRPRVDGGYYAKTADNRPLIGPVPVEGAYVTCAFSGYGIMTACAAGELLQAHVTGGALPPYANAFLPARFDDPAYLERVSAAPSSGQI
ncbi:MAG: NAD(P)/FAD-dependent oxidoreductase [Gammaproteobacteria bacterium]